jgi:hypothetical protein
VQDLLQQASESEEEIRRTKHFYVPECACEGRIGEARRVEAGRRNLSQGEVFVDTL